MKKLTTILLLSSLYLVSCAGNSENKDDHGHVHGENGEHVEHEHSDGDNHGHDGEDHHEQEEFTVDDDSLESLDHDHDEHSH